MGHEDEGIKIGFKWMVDGEYEEALKGIQDTWIEHMLDSALLLNFAFLNYPPKSLACSHLSAEF